jgi:hypothetical protein
MRKRRGDAGRVTSGTIRGVWIPQHEMLRRDVREVSANYIGPENTTACRVGRQAEADLDGLRNVSSARRE